MRYYTQINSDELLDIYYIESIFINFFCIVPSDDMFAITYDFLQHEKDNIHKYAERAYIPDKCKEVFFELSFSEYILSLIYSGYKEGSLFCQKLLLKLFNLYCKKEYRMVKTIKELKIEHILEKIEQARNPKYGEGLMDPIIELSKIIVISMVMEKDIEKKVIQNLPGINDLCKELELRKRNDVKVIEKYSNNQEISEKELEILGSFSEKELEQLIKKTNIYASTMNNITSFNSGYITNSIVDRNIEPGWWYPTIVLFMRTLGDKFDELYNMENGKFIIVLMLRGFFNQFFSVSCLSKRDEMIKVLLGSKQYPEPSLYKPLVDEKIIEEPMVNTKSDGEKSEVVEFLQMQNEKLQTTIHMKEEQIKQQRELYEREKFSNIVIKNIEKENKELKLEVIALRNFAYSTRQKDIEDTTVNVEQMKEKLSDKKIVIVGGPKNWINALKEMFPKWVFVGTESGAIKTNLIANSEMLIFNTDFLNHAVYNKYTSACAKTGVPYGFVHNTNIDRAIQDIYKQSTATDNK